MLFLSCLNEDYQKFRNTFSSLKGKKEITIVIVGDSISNNESSLTGTTFSSFLKPKLEKLLDTRISMINSSRPDETVEKAIRHFQEDVLSFRPDVVFIMLGMVDSNLPNLLEQTYEEIAGNYFRMNEKEDILSVVLSTTGYRDSGPANEDLRFRLSEFNEITMVRAKMAHLPVIDLADYMEQLRRMKPDEYVSMFQDDIHLNEKGQKYVADFLHDTIKKALIDK
jgi:lysophospholipase L1-like esterase